MRPMTLCYLMKDHQWLMLYRNQKENDINEGKWIGVGGKVEPNETVEEGMKREILEETGFTANSLFFHGILYFIYEKKEADKIYVYSCHDFSGNMHPCNEGQLEWIDEDQILNLELWNGDRCFLEKMLNDPQAKFCITLHYDEFGNLIEVKELEECEDE